MFKDKFSFMVSANEDITRLDKWICAADSNLILKNVTKVQ